MYFKQGNQKMGYFFFIFLKKKINFDRTLGAAISLSFIGE